MRDTFRVRCEQTLELFVMRYRRECFLSCERMLTCGANKANDENEVPALPNSHVIDSVNGRSDDPPALSVKTLDARVW
jgi:hypothetical protein